MFSDVVMSKEDIENFGALIPGYCVGPLREGSLHGLVIINEDSTDAPVVGIVIYRFVEEFIEVEWVGLTSDYELPDYGADIVIRLLNKARIIGGVRGVRARFREGDLMAEYFPEYEFSRSKESGGVYRFLLSDVTGLGGAGTGTLDDSCIPLASAEKNVKNGILDVLTAYEDAVPLSRPIDWERYEQNCSFIFMNNSEAQGVILVEKKRMELVLSLLFSNNSMATVTLLKKAFNSAKEKYGEGYEVVCPVVNGVSEGFVKKLVRATRHEEFICAKAVFPVGTGTLGDYEKYASDVNEGEKV